MYFPYVRGKQFEMLALVGVPMATYTTMLPIVEHVASASARFFTRMAQDGRPFILIVNPFHPRGSGRIQISTVQSLLTGAWQSTVDCIWDTSWTNTLALPSCKRFWLLILQTKRQ
ncbi:hypothetical protein BEN47_05135 [Hymenobacter lapidarius]|uniref:Uncharacterized protein n=1 Tax=Hymenobacter lapidarius TaxID=1908237 RepID=A0A1G1STQ6_9BACT|nr:hypothetical protein BEN47_05135 [Hymenobacter lapidarius]